MPSYKPITKPEELPKFNEDVEHETLDFKAKYDLSKGDIRHEIAKDLAMFANHLGGTVLVGAAEDRTTKRLRAWAPLSATEAGQLKDTAEQSLELLSPRPLLTVERFAVSDGEVVALNIEATVGGAIGVRQSSHRDAWTFPVRRASQCAFLSPELLPMYMLPEYRKTVLLLTRIGTERRVGISGSDRNPNQGGEGYYIEGINPELNLVTLVDARLKEKRSYIHIDGVDYVFQTDKGRAFIVLKPNASHHSVVGT